MEKIALCTMDGKPIIGRVEYEEAVLKVNEIIKWIKKHEKYVEPLEKAWKEAIEHTLKQVKVQRLDKYADKPEVLRYELSNDKVGLVAFLAGGISYHIHSNELTPEQRSIKIQLLGMEGH